MSIEHLALVSKKIVPIFWISTACELVINAYIWDHRVQGEMACVSLCKPNKKQGLGNNNNNTVSDSFEPMDCSLPSSSVHGILQEEYWSRLPIPPPGDLHDAGGLRFSVKKK